jgi:xylose dehydrogenase (NAD/NADP)
LGCGNHAHNHAQAIRENPSLCLAACADVSAERSKKFAEQYGAAGHYASIKEMAGSHQLDLLIIAAFPTIHPELVKTAIRCGIRNILCEKPIALSYEQVKEISELAEQSNVLIVEGLMYRGHPQIQEALNIVRSGSLGEIRYIHGQFSDYANKTPGNWRMSRDLGGGAMTAKGCYLVDACNLFSGSRAKSAFALETTDDEFHVEIGVTGTLVYENGVTAQFETNHRSMWREEIKVVGTLGTLCIPHAIVTKEQTRQILVQKNGAYESRPMETQTIEFGVFNNYALQLENLSRCITLGEPPIFPLSASLTNYRVTDAVMKSTQTGKLEDVIWEE